MDKVDFVVPTLTTPVNSLDYNMNHKFRGLCLILEHENFDPNSSATKRLDKRIGTDVDSSALNKTFTNLGFDVILRKDLTGLQIKSLLKEIADLDHSENDCFVCFVLTHGDHGSLYAFDTRYPVDKLFSYFLRCPTLVGKPKLVFLQACQGDLTDRGVAVQSSKDALDTACFFKIPTYADFLICYSTLPGFYSFRNTDRGSWFISSLVNVIEEYHLKLDLLSMMTIVSQKVAYNFTSNSENPAGCGFKQTPCITSLLTRRVYLFPKLYQI